jgi:hypothetical protein
MALPLNWVDKHPNQTHVMTKSRVYKIWTGMHSRCKIPSATGYKNYGGKGVSVCERWNSFENFLSDMGDAPDGMSIDRKDSTGNYEPENCKWATRKEQNRNQFDLPMFEYKGKTQCLSAWAEEVGSTFGTIKARLNNGWTFCKAIETPIRAHKQYVRGAA